MKCLGFSRKDGFHYNVASCQKEQVKYQKAWNVQISIGNKNKYMLARGN